ncbi:helix-turn-helix transcriptional regulator [Actinomadura viridis]|uniref:Transcriptional regulator with XRE-family HTH domain n=1 Tax=Actinomadura viridis TaxID=58110 RepID=A0A931DGY0_9ACTN|nr:helix-turn-helix transcriptional regulator [Actinomadura viridis]MBG6089875.1 transcriptional regulator with XRE-family HTH domain [Actinomadura viridis]
MPRTSPTGRRRHLARELLHLRETTSLTADAVAKQLGWTPSTLTRIERNDWRIPKVHLVEALLDVYGVTGTRRDELIRFALQARDRGWWSRHKHLSSTAATFIGLEQEAVVAREVSPLRIPDLLQTPEYARALHPTAAGDAAAAIITQRKKVLHEPDPLIYWVIVAESALRQQVGGREAHADQLDHLLELAGLNNVRLQIYPLTAPAPLLDAFIHLTFRHVIDPEAVYVAWPGCEAWHEDPAEVTPFTDRFEELLAAALTRTQSRRLLAEIADQAR